MQKNKLILFLIIFSFLVGCGGRHLQIKNANMLSGANKKDFAIEPFESLLLEVTPNLRAEKVTVVKGVLNDILFGEYFPGRIRWNGLAETEDGKEIFCQILFTGFTKPTKENPISFPEVVVVIDAPEEIANKASVISLSTGVTFGYDLAANEFQLVQREFRRKYLYRKDLITQKGTKIKNMKKVTKHFLKAIKRWNAYETKDGKQYISPIGTDDLKLIASINPHYTFLEKLIGDSQFSVSLDPIGSALGVVVGLIRAGFFVPEKGWDYNSELPSRRNMGFIIAYLNELQRKRNQIIEY